MFNYRIQFWFAIEVRIRIEKKEEEILCLRF
jgi:hypothetical protein